MNARPITGQRAKGQRARITGQADAATDPGRYSHRPNKPIGIKIPTQKEHHIICIAISIYTYYNIRKVLYAIHITLPDRDSPSW